MLNVREGVVVLHVWWTMLRGERLFSGMGRRVFVFILVVVVITALVLEVGWALVFMGLSVLATRQQVI